MALDDYILVKDQDGNLKYFKDGKYFNIEEIDQSISSDSQIETEKSAPKEKPSSHVPLQPTRTLYDVDLKSEDADEEPENPEHLVELKKNLEQTISRSVAGIIADLKVNFSDENTKRKFESIIASRLRDVRGDKELLYILTVPKDAGGLGLSEERANLVLSVTKKYLPQGDSINGSPLGKEKKQTLYEKKEVLSTVKPVMAIDKPSNTPVKPASVESTSPSVSLPVKPVLENKELSRDVVDQLLKQAKSENILAEILPTSKPDARPVNPTPIRRHVPLNSMREMTDVTMGPKLYSPVDELKTMDLVNLHRLGKDIEQQLAVIKEKIETLKQESWKRGIQGIKAWRSSAVYQLYYQIGIDSVMSGRPIADIIVDRQIKNEPTLTPGEFDAILRFNKNLEV